MKTKHDKQTNHKYKLAAPNDPILWREAEEVKYDDDLRFVDGMEKIFRHSPSAVGLAAPQIGVGKRLVMICPEATKNFVARRQATLVVAVNPVIVSHGVEREIGPEGCLSFPGFVENVERYKDITVQYRLMHYGYELSDLMEVPFTGWEARVWQHEIDHVNGICRVGNQWRRQRLGV